MTNLALRARLGASHGVLNRVLKPVFGWSVLSTLLLIARPLRSLAARPFLKLLRQARALAMATIFRCVCPVTLRCDLARLRECGGAGEGPVDHDEQDKYAAHGGESACRGARRHDFHGKVQCLCVLVAYLSFYLTSY